MGMTVASFQEAGICPLFHMLLNSPKRTLRTFTGRCEKGEMLEGKIAADYMNQYYTHVSEK